MEARLEQELRLLEEQPVVPSVPRFNNDFTAFEWNGAVYTIPVEYYGMPVNVKTMRRVAMYIVETQERMIQELSEYGLKLMDKPHIYSSYKIYNVVNVVVGFTIG